MTTSGSRATSSLSEITFDRPASSSIAVCHFRPAGLLLSRGSCLAPSLPATPPPPCPPPAGQPPPCRMPLSAGQPPLLRKMLWTTSRRPPQSASRPSPRRQLPLVAVWPATCRPPPPPYCILQNNCNKFFVLNFSSRNFTECFLSLKKDIK